MSRWELWALIVSLVISAALFGTAGAIVGYFLDRHL
jgi:hypothetical protein